MPVDAPQLSLDLSRRPSGRGGWRPNAGRPKGRTSVAHVTREDFAARYPQHITLRLLDGLPSLRNGDAVRRIWDAIARAQRDDFRIVEFGVEPNHMHMMTEADHRAAVSSGITRFKMRMVAQLNDLFCYTGPWFGERYHSRVLETPREVKYALRYVLLNWRHHLAERGERLPKDWIDPYSSAIWFDGWSEEPAIDAPWKQMLREMPPPTVPPQTWLLRVGWRRHGLIGVDEVPGRRRASNRCRRPRD
ncbi:MAG TPA: transposase [Kofleriaceae bacterium]|nr:transposase [Kofleriaceae bacterium]